MLLSDGNGRRLLQSKEWQPYTKLSDKRIPIEQTEAIQRWSAICRVWPWTLTYQKFLLCVS